MGDATWLASPPTNIFTDPANWSTGSVPNEIATFAASTTTSIVIYQLVLGELKFNAGAPAYTFTVVGPLTLNGGGIVDNSSNAPTINVQSSLTFALGGGTGDATINVLDNATLVFNGVQGNGGAISGSGKVIINAPNNNFFLGGNLTYTGGTTVTAGTVYVTSSLAPGSALQLTGGIVNFGATNQTIGAFSAAAGSSILLAGGTLTDAYGLIINQGVKLGGSGVVQATVDGAGKVQVGGTLEFTSPVDDIAATNFVIDAGVLKFDSRVGAGAVPTVTFNNFQSGQLDLSSTTLPAFHAVINGFASGDSLKIASAASVSLDGTGKILTAFGAAHNSLGTLTFGSSYTGSSFVVVNQVVSLSGSTTVDYSTATGGVYVDLLAPQFAEHAPAGQGWSGGPGSVTPVSTDGIAGFLSVNGSAFDDLLAGGTSNGTLSGGAGNDVIYGDISQTTADNSSQLTLDGGTGSNALYGSSAFNTFIGGDANGGFDQIWGGASKMAAIPGYTNNVLTFAGVATGESVYVDLRNGHNAYINSGNQNNGTYTLEDSIANVPNVIGSSGGDVIIDDNGLDRITGGVGSDQLYAGGGFDTFVYTSYGDSNVLAGYDTIYGFQAGTDKIDLSALHSDPSHVLIETSGTANSVYLEATRGSFNPNTDLAINVLTTAPGGLQASDFVF